MEMIKLLGFIYVAGILVHFYFLPISKAILWPMVLLGISMGVLAILVNALANVLVIAATAMRVYGISLTYTTLLPKDKKDEKSHNDNIAA